MNGPAHARTAVVTGAAGFIGSHVCDRLLAEGWRVAGVDDLSTGRIANLAEARSYGRGFVFENIDIRDEALPTLFERDRPELVMHLAAQSSVAASMTDPLGDADVNVMGTLCVLDAAVRTGVRKIVYAASGGSLYGEARRLPVKETAAGSSHPASPYGVSKKVVEDYLRVYRAVRNLDYTALGLANVYGPRQATDGEAGVVAIFGASMLAGKPPTIFGDGNQTRDFVYVNDVVDAFARAVDAGGGRFLNVGTGLETTVNHLYRAMAAIVGFGGEPVTGPERPGDIRRVALDASLAETHMGWKPWTSLEEGLRETIEALKAELRQA